LALEVDTVNHWKDSRAVQFATGATFIIVLAWWMFTGDLPFLSRVAFSPPAEEGSAKSIDVLGVVLPMLVQACVIIGANIIGIQTGIWSAIVALFNRLQSRPKTPQESEDVARPLVGYNPPPNGPAPDPPRNPYAPADDTRSAVLELGQAAADGLPAAEILRLAAVVRKPFAVQSLMEAYAAEDLQWIQAVQSELAAMIEPAPTTKKASSAK